MAKKMFRKLIMISAVLLLLVSSQANADCESNCNTQYWDCWSQAVEDHETCIDMVNQANQMFDSCVLSCILQGGSSYYCEQIVCVGLYVNPQICDGMITAAMAACEDDYYDCIDACY